MDSIAGTHDSDTCSVSERDAPGGSETITLKESSWKGGRKLEPKPVATWTAYPVAMSESSTTHFGKRRARDRNGL